MYEITTIDDHGRRRVIATVVDFAEAKNTVNFLGCAFMEDDADYPECADAYLNDGRVVAIQPVGFKLKEAAYMEKAKAHSEMMHNAMKAFDAEFLK